MRYSENMTDQEKHLQDLVATFEQERAWMEFIGDVAPCIDIMEDLQEEAEMK